MLALTLALASLATEPPKAGQVGHIGLGVGLGSNVTGLSAKWLPANDHAFQGLVGVAPGSRALGYSYGPLAAELDYLYEMPIIADVDPALIRWTLGFGGSLVTRPVLASVQAIAGVEVNFVDAPVDISIEYRPSIGIFIREGGGVGFDPFGVGGHVRVWL